MANFLKYSNTFALPNIFNAVMQAISGLWIKA